MKIQKTFDDLVFGTFGRAFWVLDDIGPLREYARTKYTNKAFDIVSATDGYLANNRSYQGIRFIGQAEFVGENKGTNAMISMWIKPDKEDSKSDAKSKEKKKEMKEDKVRFYVVNAEGDTIRQFSREVKEKGLFRTNWNLRADGVRGPSRNEPKKGADLPSGMSVLPGTYKIYAQYGEEMDEVSVDVMMDPRVDYITADDLSDLQAAFDDFNGVTIQAADGFDRLKEAKKSVELIEKLTSTLDEGEEQKQLKESNKDQKMKIEELMALYMDKPDLKGIQRNPNTLNRKLGMARRYMRASYGAPTPNAQIAVDQAKVALTEVMEAQNEYFDGEWAEYKSKVEAMKFELFED